MTSEHDPHRIRTWSAFDQHRLLHSGPPAEVAAAVRARPGLHSLLVFDDSDGSQVDIDRPPPEWEEAPQRGRGRPKLGVVAREVTLLPRHWAWLASQPGGASVALRRLVDEARKSAVEADRKRTAQTTTYRIMLALAGDAPGYEEALRALYAGDAKRFEAEIYAFPPDVRAYVARVAKSAFS